MGQKPGQPQEVLASDWDPKTYSLDRVLAEVLAEAQNTDRYSAAGTVFMFSFRGVKVKIIKNSDAKKVVKAWKQEVAKPDSREQGVEIGPEYK